MMMRVALRSSAPSLTHIRCAVGAVTVRPPSSSRPARCAATPVTASSHRALHVHPLRLARLGSSAAVSVANGIMSVEDDYFQRGVPSPLFCFADTVDLDDVFRAHDHVDPYAEVAGELTRINSTITQVLGSDHPMLERLASYFFDTGGKRIRPAILFLISRAMDAGERTDVTFGAAPPAGQAREDVTFGAAPPSGQAREDVAFGAAPQPGQAREDVSFGAAPPVGQTREESVEVNIPDLGVRPSHSTESPPSSTGTSMADFIFSPSAAAASALDAASTLVALAPKLSPLPLPPLPPLPTLPFEPFSYDASALARRTGGITESQRRLSEVIEMIHTASLLHDDVLDSAATRRNVPSLNAVFGNKLSILAGDFLLARASVSLARLRDPLVTESVSSIIEHLVKGEIMQLKPSLTCANASPTAAATTASPIPRSFFRPSSSAALTPEFRVDLSHYLTKSYYKTASMLAHGCRSAALLGAHSPRTQQLAEEYGKNLGLAFQIVDDLLDITSTSSMLGKPAFNDLASGVVTAPILFALEAFPQEVLPIIERRASKAGDKDVLYALLARSDAIVKTQRLAEECAAGALAAVMQFKPSRAQSALVGLVQKVLTREK
jgi:geranylgeranyl pyrophosphate synthase